MTYMYLLHGLRKTMGRGNFRCPETEILNFKLSQRSKAHQYTFSYLSHNLTSQLFHYLKKMWQEGHP